MSINEVGFQNNNTNIRSTSDNNNNNNNNLRDDVKYHIRSFDDIIA